MREPDPGLPLHALANQVRCVGVRFDCCDCRRFFDLPFDVVAGGLQARQVGGWGTLIRHVAKFARKPCAACGGRRFITAPAWR